MEHLNLTKKKVLITLDVDLHYHLRSTNTRVLKLINNLVRNHLSLSPSPLSSYFHNHFDQF